MAMDCLSRAMTAPGRASSSLPTFIMIMGSRGLRRHWPAGLLVAGVDFAHVPGSPKP